MDDFDFIIFFLIAIIIVGGGIFSIWYFAPEVRKDYSKNQCKVSCEKMEMDYLQYNDTFFGVDTCWCLKDNESKQIY